MMASYNWAIYPQVMLDLSARYLHVIGTLSA